MNIPQDSNKKKSWEHQALQISKFGVNQATTEQDTATQNLEILPRKLPRHLWFLSNFGDFYWLYLVQYWPGNHLKWGYPKALWALCDLWV